MHRSSTTVGELRWSERRWARVSIVSVLWELEQARVTVPCLKEQLLLISA